MEPAARAFRQCLYAAAPQFRSPRAAAVVLNTRRNFTVVRPGTAPAAIVEALAEGSIDAPAHWAQICEFIVREYPTQVKICEVGVGHTLSSIFAKMPVKSDVCSVVQLTLK